MGPTGRASIKEPKQIFILFGECTKALHILLNRQRNIDCFEETPEHNYEDMAYTRWESRL